MSRLQSLVFFALACSCWVGCLGAGPISVGPSAELCPPFFEERAATLLGRRGMQSTATFFPRGEARAQELRYPGKVCPDAALLIAVEALVTSEVPESLSEVSEVLGVPHCSAPCYFNRRTSLFGLVADERSLIRSRFLPRPPEGSLEDHWVFFLSVPDLGEHGYWALVARDGTGVATVSQN